MMEGGAGMGNAVEDDSPSFRAYALRRLGSHYIITDQMLANQTASIKNLLTRLS